MERQDDSFEAARDRAYPDREAIDAMALRFVKSWHKHPMLREALMHQGVNVGELDEFELIQKIIPILVAHFEGPRES